ncbi:hypothetical protein DPV78_009487 [Talaromyces pinophilus]|nr:hypothetical protein DPV78_009487 [Talaromyces pinophilus]
MKAKDEIVAHIHTYQCGKSLIRPTAQSRQDTFHHQARMSPLSVGTRPWKADELSEVKFNTDIVIFVFERPTSE